MNFSTIVVTAVAGFAGGTLATFVLLRQCRRPAWWPGRLIARSMNSSHRSLTIWGLSHLPPLATGSVILDVGCGGGRTIQQLALQAPDGKVFGIDYSAASLAVARQTNAAGISAGQVDIRQGSVSSLPFAAETFDLVTAIETHYYWPDLEADLREVHRVLRPAGRLAIIAEAYLGGRHGNADLLSMRLLGATLLSVDGHRAALVAAGFVDVEVFQEKKKGWLCAVGVRGA